MLSCVIVAEVRLYNKNLKRKEEKDEIINNNINIIMYQDASLKYHDMPVFKVYLGFCLICIKQNPKRSDIPEQESQTLSNMSYCERGAGLWE